MSAKDSNTNSTKFIMYRLVKMCVNLSKKVLKLIFHKCLWTTMILFFLIVLWTIKDNNTCVTKQSSQNPVIVWWTKGFPGTSETRFCPNDLKCDIFSDRNTSQLYNVESYLFYGSNIHFDDLPLPRQIEEVIWALYHEESPRNVDELMHEPILNLFNYSSTVSRHSDVPFPLQHLQSLNDITTKKYFVETSTKNLLLQEISPVMYLQTDCETSTERDIFVKELMKYVNIDSYGACLRNKEMPLEFSEDYLNNLNDDEFLKFVARYKFVVAIENGVCDDYVTEKFWRAIKVGTVPIYFGSPSIRDWFPNNKSAILIEDFPTPYILSQHIKKINSNDSLYEQYLEHKTKEIITNERLLEELKERGYQLDPLETAEEFECFICRKLYEKRKGQLQSRVVSKSHYDCPKPISALTLQVNPSNHWVYSWETAKRRALKIYSRVMNEKK